MSSSGVLCIPFAREPLALLKRGHYRNFFRLLLPGPKRCRGTVGEILENVYRLGLSDYYGLHRIGIEFKRREIFERGIVLQDIWRADIIVTYYG